MNIKAVTPLQKALLIAAATIIILCAGIYLYLLVQVISSQNDYSPVKSDCIIILGHSLDKNNEPSKWLVERLETGLEYYKLGYAEYIIVTGGAVRSKPTVASVMTRWLVDNGVPSDKILTEEQSKNTAENFLYSKALAESFGLSSALIVTNDFHIYRSMRIAEDFFKNISGTPAKCDPCVRKILAYMKEPLSILKYKVLRYIPAPPLSVSNNTVRGTVHVLYSR